MRKDTPQHINIIILHKTRILDGIVVCPSSRIIMSVKSEAPAHLWIRTTPLLTGHCWCWCRRCCCCGCGVANPNMFFKLTHQLLKTKLISSRPTVVVSCGDGYNNDGCECENLKQHHHNIKSKDYHFILFYFSFIIRIRIPQNSQGGLVMLATQRKQ